MLQKPLTAFVFPFLTSLLAGAAPGSAQVVLPEVPAHDLNAPPACRFAEAPACQILDGPAQLSKEGQLTTHNNFPHFDTLTPLTLLDREGVRWTAPAGTFTDGASIPEVFVPLIGNPTDPGLLEAGILHDAYCGFGNEDLETFQSQNWEDTHRMFFDALITSGIDETRAKIMFAAVYLGGPRWDEPQRDLSSVPRIRRLQEMDWCIEWIERMNPSRERIIEWMSSREVVLLSPTHVPPNWDALFAETPE